MIPVLLLILNPIHKTMALSPSFELQEIINQNHHWVQTYGNSDAHLKTNYTDILAVDYISNRKNLNATLWLASGFKNSSISTYNQPDRKIAYGMLIDADSNTKTKYIISAERACSLLDPPPKFRPATTTVLMAECIYAHADFGTT